MLSLVVITFDSYNHNRKLYHIQLWLWSIVNIINLYIVFFIFQGECDIIGKRLDTYVYIYLYIYT